MVAELLLLSLIGCLLGGLLLAAAIQLPSHSFAKLAPSFWIVGGLPLALIGWTFVTQARANGLSAYVVGVLSGVSGGWAGGLALSSPAWQAGTLLAAVVPTFVFVALTVSKPSSRGVSALLGLCILVVSGTLFTLTTSLVLMFVAFELLLLVSLYLLRLTAKSDRVVEAVAEMFFWTLTGSVGLFLGVVLLLTGGVTTITGGVGAQPLPTLATLLLCLGFGVKLPIWPCFSWLLKAHVEASVEFSILLSGIVVKFGALGLQRVLSLQEGGVGGFVLAACCTVAVVEASLRILAQRDLKRIVALTTVIEVNWIGVCLGLGGSLFERVGVLVLVAHSLTTAAEFFMVECLYRRYRTRDLSGLAGVAAHTPLLFSLSFLNVLTTIGFPGSSLFAAKLLFLTALVQHSVALFLLFLVLLVLWLPLVFMRVWVPIWYGQSTLPTGVPDLLGRETALLTACVLGSLWLGLYPTAVLL